MNLRLTKIAPYHSMADGVRRGCNDCWRFRMVDTDSGYQHQMMVTPEALQEAPHEYLDYIYRSMAQAIASALTDRGLDRMLIIDTTSEEFDNPKVS